MTRRCEIGGPGGGFFCGSGEALTVIAGPCVLESRELAMTIGLALRNTCAELGLRFVFKASYDKANRSSAGAQRGPGLEEGLAMLDGVRSELGVPVTTDVHAPEQCGAVAQAVDVMQIPAFLCRQTDLLVAAGGAASSGARATVVNVKKGQFLSPGEMGGPVDKVRASGCERVIVTERGTFFGYHRLVNDFIGIGELLDGVGSAEPAPPVCFDATHSVQKPGARDASGALYSDGQRHRVPSLALASVAAGVDLLFLECHPDPASAPSDAANMLVLDEVPALLQKVAAVREALAS